MSNTITAFLERLTAASGDYNKAKVQKNAFLGNVYVDVKPEVARAGQTIRVPFPDLGAWSDQAGNDWDPDDVNPNYVDVTFNTRPGKSILVRDFDEMQTSTDIIDQFLDPMFKRGMEFANGQLAALVTTSNFNAYPALQSSKLSSVDVDTAANAWDVLTGNSVPIVDPRNAALIVHNNVNRNMVTDGTWNQESLVGVTIAQGQRVGAADQDAPVDPMVRQAFGFSRYYDQAIATGKTANLTGTVTTTTGSTAVTGASTKFTTDLAVGSWVTFGSDTKSYRVAAIGSDTALTLTQNYAGTGGSGVNFKRTTYTCVAMHRYAMALAVRPLEIVNDGHIHSRLVVLNGIPFRVMVAYNQLKSGWLLTMDYGMAAAVLRPDFGIVINC